VHDAILPPDDDEQARERVRGMLRLSLSADTTGHTTAKLQGHILRVYLPKACEETGMPGVGQSCPLADLMAQADDVWKNHDAIYVNDLEALRASWWGREERQTDFEVPIADDADSALRCVMTVEKSSDVETEAALFEQCVTNSGVVFRRQTEFPVPNSRALREATRRLRTEIERLEEKSEALLVSLGDRWQLSELPDDVLRVDDSPLRDIQAAADDKAHHDAATSQLADPGGAAQAAHAHGRRVQGRLSRGFSRKQLAMIGAALRQQAPSMSEEQWHVWVNVYKALKQQRALPVPLWSAGRLVEEGAGLMEQVLDLFVAARSCRNSAPAPWKLVKLWVVSRLCCASHLDISPPHDGGAEEAARCRSTGVWAIRRPSDVIVGGGVRESGIAGGLEVETWLIKTRFSGSLSKPAPLPAAETPGGSQGAGPQKTRRQKREEALKRMDEALAKRLSLLFEVKGEQRESRHLQRAASDPQQHFEPSAGDDAAAQRGEETRQWYKEKQLGRGGFANVHRGFWYKAGGGVEFIAIKELDGRNVGKDVSVSKLAREARVMAMLKHTHLVRYYGHTESVKPYILMEYCPDGTLRSLASSCAQAHFLPCTIRILEEACRKPFSPGKIQMVARQDYGGPSWKRFVRSTVCVYLRQILEGLRHMHDLNMIHRDLKAENVLLTDHARCAKLADFGETHVAAPGEFPNVTYTQAQTLGHCPPEFYWLRAEGAFADRAKNQAAHAYKMDVWALGCIAVELMTGHKPEHYLFECRGLSPDQLENSFSMLYLSSKMAKECPEQLRLEYREHPVITALAERDKVVAFLDCCFAVDPQERASAAELLEMDEGLMQQAKKCVMLPPG